MSTAWWRRPAVRAGREQDGFVLVSAIAVLTVVVLLGAATISATVSGVSQAHRGTADTQALQAAEAAANIGWDRINLVHLDGLNLSATTPCLSWDLAGNVTAVADLVLGGVHWCPAVPVAVPGATQASYQLSQLNTGARFIVGSATVGSVTRRVRLTLNTSSTTTPLFQGFGLISLADLYLGNQTQVKSGSVRSNGNITLDGTAAPCHVSGGSITPGPGKIVTIVNNASTCGGSTTPASSAISLSAVSLPGTNDDSRICTAGQDACQANSFHCTAGTCTGDISWSPTTQSLVLQNQAQVTLTGNNYVFCRLDLKASTVLHIHPANGRSVQIYFPPPSLCSVALLGGAQQLYIENQSKIDNLTGLGAAGVQFLLAGGSPITASQVTVDNTTGPISAVFYGPSSTINLINQEQIVGAVAAAAVTMTANATVTYDPTAANVGGSSGNILYSEHQYLECTSQAPVGQAPDTGCP